jgi:ATP-dependent helicase/DNAse subunit B
VSGEMSRFLYQLIYESTYNEAGELIFPTEQGDFRIHRQTLSSPVQTITPSAITIPKDEQIMQQLYDFVVQEGEGHRRLTPSALNTYLDCRLRFYYQYIAKIEQLDEVKEEVDPLIFGNILHKTMEILYTRLIREKEENVV